MLRFLKILFPVSQVFIIVLLLTSCDQSRLYEENFEIPGHMWNKNNSVEFSPIIEDTLSAQNIYVNIRNSGNYAFSNLFLFVTTMSPNRQWIKDTIEIQLANSKGKWLGSGIGDLFFSRKLYKFYVRFPMKGVYKFSVQQGMRVDDLKGIHDVGIRIEKAGISNK